MGWERGEERGGEREMEKDSWTLQPCPPQTQVKSLAFLYHEHPGTALRKVENRAEVRVKGRVLGGAVGAGCGRRSPASGWGAQRCCFSPATGGMSSERVCVNHHLLIIMTNETFTPSLLFFIS